jgi:hypothetical protein
MQNKKRRCIMTLVILFMAGYALGQVKAAGKLLIPTADIKKPYQAVITITRAEIVIECQEKIFQLFNKFKAPKHRKIRVKTAELSRLYVFENTIYILTKDAFFFRYRNIFMRCWQRIGIHYGPKERWAIIFITDDPEAMGAEAKELIKAINKQCRAAKG